MISPFLRRVAPSFLTMMFAGFTINTFAAETLQVKAGDTRRLSEFQAEAVFDEWVLGDGATVILPDSVESWRLEVRKASIGKNVRILGTGSVASAGIDGASVRGKAASCEDGEDGKPGGHGQTGASGVSLSLRIAIASIESLTVNVAGGEGGNGGAGGSGQSGGNPKKCTGGRGGNGGAGGDGGDGGNGGNVRIYYSLLPESGLEGGIVRRIKINTQPGSGGTQGAGGNGGESGEGHYVQMRTLSGSQKWIGGGKPGRDGQPGKTGRSGIKGQFLLEEDLSRRIDQLMEMRGISPARTNNVQATGSSDLSSRRFQQLEEKLDAVLMRLEALERKDR